MLIRSQDKMQLYNLGNMTRLYIKYDSDYDEYDIRCGEDVLGSYSTDKKATKVLDMIMDTFQANVCIYGIDRTRYTVFIMPPDEEVVV